MVNSRVKVSITVM